MKSLLDFKEARIQALTKVGEGKKIAWFLDFGFFDRLSFPFGDDREGKALHLAIDHFLKTLYPEFEAYTEKVCLYKGSPVFPLGKDPYEASKIFSEYLDYLIANIYDRVPLSLDFDCEGLSPLKKARLVNRELYSRFKIEESDHFDRAVLLPSVYSEESAFQHLDEMMMNLKDYKVISEPYLVAEWAGLNELYVSSASITPGAYRKLLGFNAAGGLVITAGSPLNLPLEKIYQPSP
ncbi:MAG: hypothetical protein ACK4HV_07215 [Parachlamydiaceae bacterium]